MRLYATRRRSRLNGKSAGLWTALPNGLRPNGANAQRRADRMEREREKFTARKSAQMGEFDDRSRLRFVFDTLIICCC